MPIVYCFIFVFLILFVFWRLELGACNILFCPLLLVAIISIVGCSPTPVSELPTAQESPSVEATVSSSREAVFVYGQDKEQPRTLSLKLGEEPKLLTSGYLQLVGLVGAERPAALFELAGKGHCLVVGDEVGGYLLASVDQTGVSLIKHD